MSFRPHWNPAAHSHPFRALAPLSLTAILASGVCQSARSADILAATLVHMRQPQEMPRARERVLGPVTFKEFHELRWSPETSALHVTGPVTIVYADPATKVETVLTAHDLDYDPSTNRVRAPGVSTLVRPDGRFQGSNIDFNLRTNTGRVEQASLASDYFTMTGDVIESLPNGSYRLLNGYFTTCNRGKPDYRLHAKDLQVDPNRFVTAHNVQLFLDGTALPAIPYFRRSLASGSGFPLPTPSYNKSDGIGVRLHDSPIERPYEALDFDVRVNFRRAPTGFAVYQHDLGTTPFRAAPPRILLPSFGDPLSGVLEQTVPPTYREYSANRYTPSPERRTVLFATIQNEQFVFNRRRSDLNVSRFPEVGIEFLNVLGRRPPGPAVGSENTIPDAPPTAVGAAARYHTPNTSAILNVTAGMGEFIENPTHVSAGRAGMRANLATQPLLLGRRFSMRAGFSEFLNVYTTGSVYEMFGPEAELDLVPTTNSRFNVGYRYVSDAGSTPFTFDRRDIRHELRLQYQVSGPWAFGILSKIDLERSRAYDGELAVARNYDCMQIAVVYRLRSQSFNVLFSLLPPRRERDRPLMPLRRGT